MAKTVENVNVRILQECREQIGLTIDEVSGKVASIVKIESGGKPPSFKQLDTLAHLYNVPRWVFISEEIPEKYRFARMIPLAFRQFLESNRTGLSQSKVRTLVFQVGLCRDLIIELQEDMDEPVGAFRPPVLEDNLSLQDMAAKIRKWLNVDSDLEFQQWKDRVEKKGVFIFMTSKYKGWSHIDKNLFRGLAINHSTLPIIIINDSDARKAQSFTLLHELGHLIRREDRIDDWSEHNEEVERWCDKLAAEVLMPTDLFLSKASDIAKNTDINDLESVRKLASFFQVSPYACLVRLRYLRKLDQSAYNALQKKLQEEYERMRQQLKDSGGGAARDRAKEVLNQYGRIYANALFQAHYNEEITLHKLSTAFGLKRVSDVLKLGKAL